MKKLTAMLCSVLMFAAALTGCGSSDSSSKSDTSTPAPASQAESEQGGEEKESSEAGAPEENSEAESRKPSSETTVTIADNAVDFAASMKLGWNLGNTLDALGSDSVYSETAWGQPKTTKEMISFVKESGFTSIRIPVSWGQHTIDDDFTIDPEWMDRVSEVVDYAYDEGMYIIINSHHDNDAAYYYPSDEHYETSEKYIKAVWTQIAANFKDYDERLVFESMNEPRLSGTGKEWWFNSNDEEGVASIKCIVKLNQVFVDTVRASGGYNETRFLMVPSNAANASNAENKAFEMPTDTASNRLLLSVHAYTPYDFAMNYSGGTDEWTAGKTRELSFMDKLAKKYHENGYGVVIGEFGATNKDNLDARVAWATDYTAKAAGLGIPCFLWDNGGTNKGDENFGMINRNELSVFYPEILDAMVASYK